MRWTGEDLHNLLNEDIEKLVQLYPEQSVANLKRRKQEYSKRISEEGVPMEQRKQEYIKDGKIVSEVTGQWQVGAYNHDTKEWDIGQ